MLTSKARFCSCPKAHVQQCSLCTLCQWGLVTLAISLPVGHHNLPPTGRCTLILHGQLHLDRKQKGSE